MSNIYIIFIGFYCRPKCTGMFYSPRSPWHIDHYYWYWRPPWSLWSECETIFWKLSSAKHIC